MLQSCYFYIYITINWYIQLKINKHIHLHNLYIDDGNEFFNNVFSVNNVNTEKSIHFYIKKSQDFIYKYRMKLNVI